MLSEWFLFLVINGDFIADLADAVAGCLSHSMVVSLRLGDVIGRNRVCIGAHDLLSSFAEHLSPSFNAVVSDSLSNVVPIETHLGHQLVIELHIVLLILTVLDDEEEGACTKT